MNGPIAGFPSWGLERSSTSSVEVERVSGERWRSRRRGCLWFDCDPTSEELKRWGLARLRTWSERGGPSVLGLLPKDARPSGSYGAVDTWRVLSARRPRKREMTRCGVG